MTATAGGIRRVASACAILLAVAACEEQSTTIGPGDPVSLRVSPDSTDLRLNTATTLRAYPLDETGAFRPDVAVEWSAEDPGIAAVDDEGVVTGVGNGVGTIVAHAGGIEGRARVRVQPAPLLSVESDSVAFATSAGGSDPPPDTLEVTNGGGFDLTGLAIDSISYGPDADGWLTAALDSFAAPTKLRLSASAVGVTTAGAYLARVHLRAEDADSSPRVVKASLTVTAGSAAALETFEGDGQAGVVGQPVPVAPAALVRDQFGNVVQGATVAFEVKSGGGSLAGDTVVSDAQGVARVGQWTLGTGTGTNTLEASVVGQSISRVTFTATAGAGAAATLSKTAGDAQTDTVGTAVPVAPAVRVTDQFGNVVPGALVTFTATTGGGTVQGSPAIANAAGVASVGAWVLGPIVGQNVLEASSGGAPVVTFSATATNGAPAQVAALPGTDGQEATAGSAVAVPPGVLVTDAFGNVVPSASVTFDVTAGGGSVNPSSAVMTEVDGRASVASWTLGTAAGENSLEATVAGPDIAGNPVTFTATATAGQAGALAVAVQPSATVEVAEPLPQQPEIQVEDAFGNPASTPGIAVTAAISSGPGGTLLGGTTATTDANGRAVFTDLRIEGTAGTYVLGFSGTDVSGANSDPFEVTHGPAESLAVVASTDNQSVTVNTSVGTPPAVIALDAFGNGVPSIAVAFAVEAGGGVITGEDAVTDDAGVASVGSWTLGTMAGGNTLSATSTGLTGSPVLINAIGDPDVPDATETTIAADATAILADNTGNVAGRRVAVTLTVRDQYGNARAGDLITFTPSDGDDLWRVSTLDGTVSNQATTNASGVASRVFYSTSAGAKTLSADVAGSLAKTAAVTVSPAEASSAQTTIAVDDASFRASDTGGSADFRSVVTVTVRDAFGNVRAGDGVTFTPSDGNDFWRVSTTDATPSNSATTSASGVASRVFYSTFAEGKMLVGTVAPSLGSSFAENIVVTVSAADPTDVVYVQGTGQTQVSGSGVTTAPTVELRDPYGNAVGPGYSLVFEVLAGGGTVNGSSAVTVNTNSSGRASVTWIVRASGPGDTNGRTSQSMRTRYGNIVDSFTFSAFAIFSYGSHVHPKWAAGGCTGCHGGLSGVTLSGTAPQAYAELVNEGLVCDMTLAAQYRRVNTGGGVVNTDQNSILMRMIDPTLSLIGTCDTYMPNASGMSQGVRDTVRAWIRNGAPNN